MGSMCMQALPEWSRSTLQAHLSDPRPHLMTDEQLDKGETGDAIWDAAQYQLALTGHSLHALSDAYMLLHIPLPPSPHWLPFLPPPVVSHA